jgi:Tol biopolymer transport system component
VTRWNTLKLVAVLGLLLCVGGVAPLAAPVPKSLRKDAGLLWLHCGDELLAYSQELELVERVKLPSGEQFLGLTPDGGRVVFVADGTYHLRPLRGGPAIDLGFDSSPQDYPLHWSPDGTRFVRPRDIFGPVDGHPNPHFRFDLCDTSAGTLRRLPISTDHYPLGWSADGRHFLTINHHGGENECGKIFRTAVDDGTPAVLTKEAQFQSAFWMRVAVSPRGPLLLCGSPDGRDEWSWHGLWVIDPESGDATELPRDPNERWVQSPCWSPDGKRIAFAWVHEEKLAAGETRSEARLTVAAADGTRQQTIPAGGKLLGWFPAGGRAVGVVPHVGDEPPVAAKRNGLSDAGLLWFYSPLETELVAYTTGGKEARRVKLPGEKPTTEAFRGITADGRFALFAGVDGKVPTGEAFTPSSRAGQLTLHRLPLFDDNPVAEDTGTHTSVSSVVLPAANDGMLHTTTSDFTNVSWQDVTYRLDATFRRGKKLPPLDRHMRLCAEGADGTLVLWWHNYTLTPANRLFKLKPGGEPELISGDLNLMAPTVSPDAGSLLVSPPDSDDLLMFDVATGKHHTAFTHGGWVAYRGVWSPDGNRVAVEWRRVSDGRTRVVLSDPDGGNSVAAVALADPPPDRWSPEMSRYLLGWYPAKGKK